MQELSLKEILVYLAGVMGVDYIPALEIGDIYRRGFDVLAARGRLTDPEGRPLGVLDLQKFEDPEEGDYWEAEARLRTPSGVKKVVLPYRGAWLWLLERRAELDALLHERGRRVPAPPPPEEGTPPRRRPRIRPFRRRVVRAAS